VEEPGAVSHEGIEAERRSGLSEEMIRQEFYCSFDAPMTGAYYGAGMDRADADGRLCNVPWEPDVDVDTAWDLGVRDSTSIVFFQQVGREVRVIDHYENSGEGLTHYVKVLREKPYVYGTHWGPHDIAQRELSTGVSRLEFARGLGIRFRVLRKGIKEDGIEAVRNVLSRCWFDRVKCSHLIEALRTYRKEWKESEKIFAAREVQDWSIHAADAFRYMALAVGAGRQSRAEDDGPAGRMAYTDPGRLALRGRMAFEVKGTGLRLQ